ncbi:MAG: isoprenylcysteine carboxylmethyltransferase family protein [Fibrobacter sp.]|nr:isoprenylcysteine carboxylmethyltransferase family protein [Fibrobacter sp.]
MNFLYSFRGWILGLLGIALILCDPCPAFCLKPSLCNLPFGALIQFVPAIILLILGIYLRVQARRVIGEHTRGFKHDADRLVTEGVYSRVRHPLYISNTCIGISFILLHLGFCPLSISFAAILMCFEILLSKMEDAYLESRFGELWRVWSKKTGAFFPRAVSPDEKAKLHDSRIRSFLDAAKADVSTWFWLAFFVAAIILRKTCCDFTLFG